MVAVARKRPDEKKTNRQRSTASQRAEMPENASTHTHTHKIERQTGRRLQNAGSSVKFGNASGFDPPNKNYPPLLFRKNYTAVKFSPKKKHFSRNGIAKGTKPPRNSSATISDRIQTLITLRLGKVSSRQVLLLLFVCLFVFFKAGGTVKLYTRTENASLLYGKWNRYKTIFKKTSEDGVSASRWPIASQNFGPLQQVVDELLHNRPAKKKRKEKKHKKS